MEQLIVEDEEDSRVWKGIKFPMGTFIVWSKDGAVATGKCDPITHEILEFNEYEISNE